MQKNLDKQFKKKVIGVAQDALIVGPDGLGDVFLEEVEQACERLSLPYKSRGTLKLEKAQIEMSNWDFRSLLELCQTLRTCREFWWQIATSHVGSIKEFVDFLDKVDWSLFIPQDATVFIKVESYQSKLYHEGLLKDELEKKLKNIGYKTTQHELNSNFKIFISQKKNRANLYLSLNGESLYKRGYKKSFYAKAPIKEHLAASLFRLLNLDTKLSSNDLVYVPFAGSGTLGFEALINLYDIRPMLWRSDFSMKEISGYPLASQKYLQKTAENELKNVESEFARVEFLDLDEKTVSELSKNIEKFSSISDKFQFSVEIGDFFESEPKEIDGKKDSHWS